MPHACTGVPSPYPTSYLLKGLAGKLRQRKRDQRVTEPGTQFAVTAGGDHDELLAVRPQSIRHRHRLAAGRQTALPQFSSSIDIERSQVIIHRRGDEDEAA